MNLKPQEFSLLCWGKSAKRLTKSVALEEMKAIIDPLIGISGLRCFSKINTLPTIGIRFVKLK